MSLQFLAILAVVLVVVWWFYSPPKPVPSSVEQFLTPAAATKEEEGPATVSTQEEPSLPTSEMKIKFELVDIENPKLRVNSEILQGTKTMINWNSKRVNEMRNRFHIMRVLDRMEFHEGPNVIEVYRAVSPDGVSTFVFSRADSDDDILELKTQTSEDPSDTKSPHRPPKHNLDVFKKQTIMIPDDMIATIRDLETSYSQRQSSSGPRAIDTHSS